MSIYIEEVRIKDFRSIKNISIKLNKINLLIGHNNSGKSNFLHAINIGLKSHYELDENDIFWAKSELKTKTKKAIIDLKIIPETGTFNDEWSAWFGDKWLVSDMDKQFVGIRTEIVYDIIKDGYIMVKRPINVWGETIDQTVVSRPLQFRSEMIDYMNSYYIDASRDFASEMKDKKSYFSMSTKAYDLSSEKKDEIETKLSDLNADIIKSIDGIKDTNETLSEIAPVIGISPDTVHIEPLARSVDDLHKGLDVFIEDNDSLSLPVSYFGMGTKSWISFLSLKAYVNYINKKLKLENESDVEAFFMLLLEEPEAHLHPQAQKQLYLQLEKFSNQRVISTHSPSIISQCEPSNLIYVDKICGETVMRNYDSNLFDPNEVKKIKREILRQKGELLFSNYVVLCEGITEEQEFPILFEKKFGHSPTYYGVSIIGVGGVNYGAFIKFLDMFSIKWLIISDGEEPTLIKLKRIFGVNKNDSFPPTITNLFYYRNGDDIEKHLIRNGYIDEIKQAIDIVEGPSTSDGVINSAPSVITKEVKDNANLCPSCNQPLRHIVNVPLNGLSAQQYTLYEYITSKNRKANISQEIAERILDSIKPVPPIINDAFDKIKNDLNIS